MVELLIKIIVGIITFIIKALLSDITWGIIGIVLIVLSLYCIVTIIVETIRYKFKDKKDVIETLKGIASSVVVFLVGIGIWSIIL